MRRRVLFWLGWWAALFVLWLGFTATLDLAELVTGVVAAAVAASAAEAVRSRGLIAFSPSWRWLDELWRLPGRTLYETWLLARLLALRLLGRPVPAPRLIALRFDPPAEPADRRAARRAVLTAVVSVTPNSYIIGVEDSEENGGEGVVLLHQLVPDRVPRMPRGLMGER
jgi:hypothetical protein